MQYRTLGRAGLQVSEVGFGGAGIGHVWGQTTDAQCVAAIHQALALGINFFDTSPMYGGGRSEENLGRGLAGRRSQVHIATKVRLQTEADRANPQAAVRHSVEESIRRLDTDYIDILQVHHQVGLTAGQYLAAVGPPPRYALLLTAADCLNLAQAMADLVKEGKVRFIGITAWDGPQAVVQELLESGCFDTAQILYNLLNQSALSPPPAGFDDIDQGQSLPVAQAQNVGVIGIRAHAAGALSNSLDRPVAADSEVARDFARAQTLQFLNQSPYSTMSQVALRYCLDQPAIATVVPGFKSPAEVADAAACSDLPPLPAEQVTRLNHLYARQFAA